LRRQTVGVTMSIFKSLASRRSENAKPEHESHGHEADEAAAANLVSLSERAKSPAPAPAQDDGFLEDDSEAFDAIYAEEAYVEQEPEPAPPMAASMWDMANDAADDLEPEPAPPARSPVAEAPTPRRSGRVKTRLLGIDHSNDRLEELKSQDSPDDAEIRFPVGWMVVVDGPGRGSAFTLAPGVSSIGRGEDQAICLDFGDTAISREGHAMVAYDEESRSFYLGHGGKSNIVRLNGRPVLTTEQVNEGDMILIGETSLILAALCGPDFNWSDSE